LRHGSILSARSGRLWCRNPEEPHLVIPSTLDNNDTRYARGQGWTVPEDFYECLKTEFDGLYREGERRPRMMTVALHCRLAGQPGRAAAFTIFVDHVRAHTKVWICKRDEIAAHWIRHHSP
jgi:allantoinase